MKYSILATALSMMLGGAALAQAPQQGAAPPPPSTAQAPQDAQRAQPPPTAQPGQPPAPGQPAPGQPAPGQPPPPGRPAQPGLAEGAPQTTTESVEVFFNTDSAQLNPGANQDLRQLASWARCNPKGAIILEGHADRTGAAAYNLELSGKRAAMVRQRLIAMGVPSDHIVVVVYGENGPRRPTLSEERRVTARTSQTPVVPQDLAG